MRCLFKGAGFSGLSANHKTAFTTTHPLVFDFLEILFTFYFFCSTFFKIVIILLSTMFSIKGWFSRLGVYYDGENGPFFDGNFSILPDRIIFVKKTSEKWSFLHFPENFPVFGVLT